MTLVWLYGFSWLYVSSTVIRFFCVVIVFQRGYIILRGYTTFAWLYASLAWLLVHFACLYGFPLLYDFSVVIRFFCVVIPFFRVVIIVLLGGCTAMCRNALQRTVTCEFGFGNVSLPSSN